MRARPVAKEGTLTKKQPLRRREPLWLQSPRISVVTRKRAPDATYDVVIVGAGISGALVADALSEKGLRLLVIDRRGPVRGSTLASTAMIQHEIDVPLTRLASLRGQADAERVWRRSAAAVEALAGRVGDLGLACDFHRKRTLFLAGDDMGSRALAAEAGARQAAGLDCSLLSGADLSTRFGLSRSAAIDSDVSASANPAQMAAGFLRLARERGATLVAGVEVTDIRSGADEAILATADGSLIGASHVVFCTGYEFLSALSAGPQRIVSTFAMASRPKLKHPDWLNDYLVWEASDPYLYFRATSDGRVIVGGEDEAGDEAYRDAKLAERKGRILAEKLGDLTGIRFGEPDHLWAAAFGTTPDGLPLIGRVPGMDRVFTAMGFGGNGITFSRIAADIISGEIVGKPDPDAPLFAIKAPPSAAKA
ncbi:NAD(P)/FAD-dependent oxidoreductase [Ensifer soli]|uniref:NAD(P)/FAD-dependent oxidoreductase n=1 Tax=Ciceribacter sp. sgz301302 TaxID=3342379 RepID=UPI0035B72301